LTESALHATPRNLVLGNPMNAQHDGIECGDTPWAGRPAYSAPRLQRLGQVSELTKANAGGTVTFDGSAYSS